MIPYSTQDINDDDIDAVVRVLRSGWLTQGPAIESFEKALAAKTGAKFAVVFNSGTGALHAAYYTAGIGRGDEVVVPALTFAATANAVLYLGAKPIFADSERETGNMSIIEAEKKITKRTKAIVVVDYSGRPADLHAFKALAKRHNLVYIEDAAQALGATYQGKLIGTQADMTMFSFHPVKSITTGEGGVIVTDNEQYAQTLRLFRTHGVTKDSARFIRKNNAAWYQEMQLLGFNYRMSDMCAALGKSQLKRLDKFISKRRAAAAQYQQLLARVPNLILPPQDSKDSQSAWHLYPVRLGQNIAHKRDEVFTRMRKSGIGVQVHHVPVYLHPFYEKMGYKQGSCPVTEAFVASEISIPLFYKITKKEQQFIVNTFRQILTEL